MDQPDGNKVLLDTIPPGGNLLNQGGEVVLVEEGLEGGVAGPVTETDYGNHRVLRLSVNRLGIGHETEFRLEKVIPVEVNSKVAALLRLGGNFLGFRYARFRAEAVHKTAQGCSVDLSLDLDGAEDVDRKFDI